MIRETKWNMGRLWKWKLFKESLGIEEEAVIEKAHRMKTEKSNKSNTPRTIVCRILNYNDKVKKSKECQKTEK